MCAVMELRYASLSSEAVRIDTTKGNVPREMLLKVSGHV